MEHEDEARKLEREADKGAELAELGGEMFVDPRREWEAKEQDPSIPGAQPDRDEDGDEGS